MQWLILSLDFYNATSNNATEECIMPKTRCGWCSIRVTVSDRWNQTSRPWACLAWVQNPLVCTSRTVLCGLIFHDFLGLHVPNMSDLAINSPSTSLFNTRSRRMFILHTLQSTLQHISQHTPIALSHCTAPIPAHHTHTFPPFHHHLTPSFLSRSDSCRSNVLFCICLHLGGVALYTNIQISHKCSFTFSPCTNYWGEKKTLSETRPWHGANINWWHVYQYIIMYGTLLEGFQ